MDENIVNKLQLPSGGGSSKSTVVTENLSMSQLTTDIPAQSGICYIEFRNLITTEQIKQLDFQKLQLDIVVNMSKNGSLTEYMQFSIHQIAYPDYTITNSNIENEYNLFEITQAQSINMYEWIEEGAGGGLGHTIFTWAILPCRCGYYLEGSAMAIGIPEKIQDTEGTEINIKEFSTINASARLEFI